MPTTLVDVFNLALSSCGSEALVTSPDENTREAALCRLWLPQVRDHIIATAPWSSVIRSSRLLLQHSRGSNEDWNDGDPAPGFSRSYTLPQHMVLPWYLHSFGRFMVQGGLLHTWDELPILTYLHSEQNPQFWDNQLQDAIIHYLAARIARPLTGNKEIVDENFQIAAHHVETAQAQAAELLPQTPTETLPDWITARGYTTTASSRFFYPFVHLNPVAA